MFENEFASTKHECLKLISTQTILSKFSENQNTCAPSPAVLGCFHVVKAGLATIMGDTKIYTLITIAKDSFSVTQFRSHEIVMQEFEMRSEPFGNIIAVYVMDIGGKMLHSYSSPAV